MVFFVVCGDVVVDVVCLVGVVDGVDCVWVVSGDSVMKFVMMIVKWDFIGFFLIGMNGYDGWVGC